MRWKGLGVAWQRRGAMILLSEAQVTLENRHGYPPEWLLDPVRGRQR